MVRIVFDQPDSEVVHAQFDRVAVLADALDIGLSELIAPLDAAR